MSITKYNILGIVFLIDLVLGSISFHYLDDLQSSEKGFLFLPIAVVFAIYMVWKDEDITISKQKEN